MARVHVCLLARVQTDVQEHHRVLAAAAAEINLIPFCLYFGFAEKNDVHRVTLKAGDIC